MSNPASRPHARETRSLTRLEVLVGEWVEHFGIPRVPDGRMVVERTLGGQALTQTSEVPHPDVPDAQEPPVQLPTENWHSPWQASHGERQTSCIPW